MDAVSREALNVFVADSRALFRKHNIDVAELNSPADLYIEFQATDTLAIRKYLEERSGVHSVQDLFYPTLRVGPLSLPDATLLKNRISHDLPIDSLRITR